MKGSGPSDTILFCRIRFGTFPFQSQWAQFVVPLSDRQGCRYRSHSSLILRDRPGIEVRLPEDAEVRVPSVQADGLAFVSQG